MHKTPLAALLLAAAPVAQSYTTSPVGYATVDGGGGNTFPWSYASGRYQQVHGDIRGTARLISGISFRRYGATTVYTSATARTIDSELYMCDSNWNTVSSTFASNYAGTPLLVVNRKMINLPDFQQPQGAPAPWNIVIPFDTPFPAAGLLDVLWEYLLYSNTAVGSYFCDYKAPVTANAGVQVYTGTGCIATGRTAAMSITASQSTNYTTQMASISWSCTNGPASAPSAILIGLVNPNLPLPGLLCANLYVDQVFLTLNATASATGAFASGTLSFPWAPGLAGLQTHAQGASADAGIAGIPVAVTRGVQTTWANMPPPPDKIARIYLSGATTGLTGTLGNNTALVSRFTH